MCHTFPPQNCTSFSKTHQVLRLLHKRISRGEPKTGSNLHFFTSHFYTQLSTKKFGSMTNWTTKKDINIFEKKFIFIPINQNSHWSLSVVVNPGSINNSQESDSKKQANLDLPCLICMDSMNNYHNKPQIRTNVETWLNSQYSQIYKGQPFNKNTFKFFQPTGKCSFLQHQLLFHFQR